MCIRDSSENEPLLITEPIEAIDKASRIAIDEGCIVYVTGSVYLVGQAIEEAFSREGGDMWNYLEAHPPLDDNSEIERLR